MRVKLQNEKHTRVVVTSKKIPPKFKTLTKPLTSQNHFPANMPAPAPHSDEQFSLLPLTPTSSQQQPVVYPLHHSLSSPISRIAISWSRGNSLRLSLLSHPSISTEQLKEGDESSGGSVVEVKLASENGGIDDNARWRKIVYGSVAPFAMFQNRKNSTFAFSKVPSGALSNADWYVEVWLFALFVCDLVEL